MTGCVAALKFEQNSWDFTARLIAKRVPMLAKKQPIRGMVLALLTASLWTTAAFADEEGYTENWLSRDSQLDQRKRGPLEIEGVNGLMDCGIECIGVGEGLMGEMMRLEVAPDGFDVV